MLSNSLPDPVRSEAIASIARYGAVCMRSCRFCLSVQDALSATQRAESGTILWRCRRCRHLNSWKTKPQ